MRRNNSMPRLRSRSLLSLAALATIASLSTGCVPCKDIVVCESASLLSWCLDTPDACEQDNLQCSTDGFCHWGRFSSSPDDQAWTIAISDMAVDRTLLDAVGIGSHSDDYQEVAVFADGSQLECEPAPRSDMPSPPMRICRLPEDVATISVVVRTTQHLSLDLQLQESVCTRETQSCAG